MKKSVRIIIATVGLLFVMALTAAPSPKSNDAGSDAARHAKGKYYFMHASQYSDQQKLAETFELYRKAYAIDPDNDAVAFNYAMYTWITTKDSATETQCMEMMRQYVDKYPGDVQSASIYATLQVRNTYNYLEAARVYNNILRQSPHLTNLYLELWRVYSAAEMPDSALSALQHYEQAEGATEQSTLAKIVTMTEYGDTTAMINTAKTYVAGKPLDSNAWVFLGSIYDVFGITDSAMMAMQKAIDLAPTASAPKSEMAKLCLAQKDTVRADSLMAQTLLSTDLTTADKAAILNDFLETLVRYEGDLHRALPLVEALLSDDPENEDAWGVKLRVHWSLKEWKEALVAARQLTVLNPTDENHWLSVLSLLASNESYGELDTTYRRICELFPNPSYGIQLMYTGVLAMAGRNQDALDVCMNEVRKILPDYTLPPRRKPEAPFPDFLLMNPDAPNAIPSSDTSSLPPLQPLNDFACIVSDSSQIGFIPCFSVPDSLESETSRLSDWLQMAADQYAALGDTAQSFSLYDNAICLNPHNTLALNNYAYFLALQRQDLEIAEMMSFTASMTTPSVSNLDTYAYVLFCQRNFEGAKGVMDLIFENDTFAKEEMSEEIYEHYGDILFMLGNPAAALTYWKKALELAPDKEILQRKVKNETFFYK